MVHRMRVLVIDFNEFLWLPGGICQASAKFGAKSVLSPEDCSPVNLLVITRSLKIPDGQFKIFEL
jgi:hypothetical protein